MLIYICFLIKNFKLITTSETQNKVNIKNKKEFIYSTENKLNIISSKEQTLEFLFDFSSIKTYKELLYSFYWNNYETLTLYSFDYIKNNGKNELINQFLFKKLKFIRGTHYFFSFENEFIFKLSILIKSEIFKKDNCLFKYFLKHKKAWRFILTSNNKNNNLKLLTSIFYLIKK